MFENYTERSRKVISWARIRAQSMMSEFIGTEHVLLGIMDEGGGVAAKIMKANGLTAASVQAEVAKRIKPPATPPEYRGQIPFTPRTKRVFELAGEAMSYYKHDVIGTEHLLIGLVKENEGIASDVLRALIPGKNLLDEIDEVLGVMRWKPWEDFKQDAETLPIPEPPCKGCLHWRPRRDYDKAGAFSGVVLCNKIGEQCNDFSCFQPR